MKMRSLGIVATLIFLVGLQAGPVSAQQWTLHVPELGDADFIWWHPSYWKTILAGRSLPYLISEIRNLNSNQTISLAQKLTKQ